MDLQAARLGQLAGGVNVIGVIAAVAILAGMLYMLFVKKYHEATELTTGDAKRIG